MNNQRPVGQKEKIKNILTCVLVAVALILVIFVVTGSSSDEDETTTQTTLTSAVVATTPAPTTTQPTTTEPTTTETTTTEPTTTQPPTTVPTTVTEPLTTLPAGPTNEEILKVVYDGINSLKSVNASFKAVKYQNIVINVTDCSFPAFLTIINSVISLIANEETFEYDFTNGKGFDPEEGIETTSNTMIAPSNIPFGLTIDGVASASCVDEGENKVYSVTLVPETGTFENPRPQHHGVACDTLDFSLFEIPTGRITKSDFNYPGAIITVTVNPQGQVIRYTEHIDMNGVGEGEAFGITASATLDGYIDESWDITWK